MGKKKEEKVIDDNLGISRDDGASWWLVQNGVGASFFLLLCLHY